MGKKLVAALVVWIVSATLDKILIAVLDFFLVRLFFYINFIISKAKIKIV